MGFQRDFNTLLNDLLTSYRNQFPECDIVEGSVLYMKSACTASALWGLYGALDKVAEQMFVATADRAHKEMHAAEFGIATTGLSDAEIVDAVLAAKRSKMAGGNKYDYAQWAREVTLGEERVTYAEVVPLARGEGTFDIVVLGNLDGGVVSDEICAEIYDYIQERRPIGSGFSTGMRICKVLPQNTQITIAARGDDWAQQSTVAAIMEYVNDLPPRGTLYLSQILSIMIQYGAIAPRVEVPLGDIIPTEDIVAGEYHVIRIGDPSDITIIEDVL